MLAHHRKGTHWSTPHKTRLHTRVEDLETRAAESPNSTLPTKRQLFREEGIPKSTAERILKSRDPRRLHHSEIRKETRGRKSQFTISDLRYVELILKTNRFDGRVLSWDALAQEACLKITGRTLRLHLRTFNYRRCVACRRSWVNPQHARRRVEWATTMLNRYPTPDHWKNVRFSDETHLGFGSPGRLWMTRQPGERECPDCIQTVKIPREKDEKRVHCWAAVGYGYKSKLYRYETNNSNGKMTLEVYRGLLEAECASWPDDWVLEEDGDSGHGTGKSNIVRQWKESHKLKSYFNCPQSPDLAPIENAWLAPKEHLRKFGHWDEDIVWELAREGWEGLSQKTIDDWCLSIPQRLRSVIERRGQMTAF